jgi:N-acetylneuraminic acid mutarotase
LNRAVSPRDQPQSYKIRTSDCHLPDRGSVGESGFFIRRLLIAFPLCLAACWIAIGIPTTSGLGFSPSDRPANVSHSAVARLTFEERVSHQRAIEEVYWRHRIWPNENSNPKPSLDAVITQAQLEEKVEDDLRKLQALEQYSHRPITPDELQAEMDRMARNTRQPEVLRELFEALGNDPFVIAECLARPMLAERLLAQPAVERVKQQSRTFDRTVAAGANYTLPRISGGACIEDTWTPTNLTGVPAARDRHTAVWTGTEMIVWGGENLTGYGLNTGGRYNPSTDSWTATSLTNAPAARADHTAVWSGSEMIVWGGYSPGSGGDVNTGGKYAPTTDTWTVTTTINAPSARGLHTAVWTGSDMIVWGGTDGTNLFNTGGRYNPSTDSWTVTSTANAPDPRNFHTAVWAGDQMIVWGGCTDPNFCGEYTGGRYNPGTNSWTATSLTNAPSPRAGHTAVWTGSEMIIWGGDYDDGGRYDPSTDSWTATSTTNAPDARHGNTAVWTGSDMIVWGGFGFSNGTYASLNTGGRYNPATDSWMATITTNAPEGRLLHTAVWTGSEMIVWGGDYATPNGDIFLNTGGRYCGQSGPGTATVADFNGDSHPDFVVRNPGTRQTGIWYLNNNVFIRGAFGPTLPVGWGLRGAADFNLDTHPDYGLFHSATRRTAIWYLSGPTFIGSAFGPTPPSGWALVATADFNANGKPDYVLYNAGTRRTAIWYLNINIFVSGAFGPTLPAGWGLRGVADFNGDTHPDYALFNAATRQTAIWYLSGPTRIGGAFGPTVPSGWALVATKDFNGNGKPDYLLYNAGTRRTAIWYLNNNFFVSAAFGPILPAGWSLIAP